MPRKLLLGNWKMYKAPSEARALALALAEKLRQPFAPDAIAVFPPFVSIAAVREALASTGIEVGGQTLHWEGEGAFTGEISGGFLADAGCRYVLIGHSERRQYFGETDETVNRRLKAALAARLTAVVCVGERLTERDAGETEQLVERQLRGALANIDAQDLGRIVVAYEPVWAIGTGRVATPEQAQAVHKHLRTLLGALYGRGGADVSIVYGGSVKADNAKGLMAQPDIDGALVGGASLDAAGFAAIAGAF